MIRYPLPSKKKFEEIIEGHAKGWLAEAKKRTAKYQQDLKYSEPPKPSWSKIKKVYMKLQFNKCAYCEQKLEGGERGPIAHDIEHYRPKSSVQVWPSQKLLRKLGYTFPTGDASDGYYLLPYNVFNYATACKVCNSTLKRNYFPVKGRRITDSDKPTRLRKEEPYLLYPLGKIDTDNPEKLITFEGFRIRPNPKITDAHKINRAQVTINFFELDIRPLLLKQRAEVVKKMFEAFYDQTEHPLPARRAQAKRDIKRWQAPSSEHAHCARDFYKVCKTDLETAFMYYNEAVDHIENNLDS